MATATEAKTVYFTVTGEYLTDIARDLLLSDEPGKAYRIIADHLIGEGGIEAALSVLKGTHDLAGDSRTGIFLTESEVTPKLRGFHKDIGFIYAGRHRRRGAWWRPVAVVTNFNKDDADYAGSRVSGGGLGGSGNLKLWGRARTEYYCNPGESVGEKMMKMSGSSDK